jgi:hypothetical protein
MDLPSIGGYFLAFRGKKVDKETHLMCQRIYFIGGTQRYISSGMVAHRAHITLPKYDFLNPFIFLMQRIFLLTKILYYNFRFLPT